MRPEARNLAGDHEMAWEHQNRRLVLAGLASVFIRTTTHMKEQST
jgi:hypothetical protein